MEHVSTCSFQFLVQSFFETLQYCDEWRKFTSVSQSVRQSVSQSVRQSVSHSVNSGGWSKFRTLCLNVIRTKVLIKITRIYWSLVIQQCMLLFVPMGKTVK